MTERTKGPWRLGKAGDVGYSASVAPCHIWTPAGPGNGLIATTAPHCQPYDQQRADAAFIVQMENNYEPLRKALALALCNLSQFEPGDSRAVSNEYVAMAAVLSGDASPSVMAVIDGALEVAERDSELCEDEGCPQSGTAHVCISDDQAGFNRDQAAEAAAKICDYADLNVTMFDACCDEVPQRATDIFTAAKTLRDLLSPERA